MDSPCYDNLKSLTEKATPAGAVHLVYRLSAEHARSESHFGVDPATGAWYGFTLNGVAGRDAEGREYRVSLDGERQFEWTDHFYHTPMVSSVLPVYILHGVLERAQLGQVRIECSAGPGSLTTFREVPLELGSNTPRIRLCVTEYLVDDRGVIVGWRSIGGGGEAKDEAKFNYADRTDCGAEYVSALGELQVVSAACEAGGDTARFSAKRVEELAMQVRRQSEANYYSKQLEKVRSKPILADDESSAQLPLLLGGIIVVAIGVFVLIRNRRSV